MRPPSGERWMPRGRLPTWNVDTSVADATSRTVTSPDPSSLTNARGPLGAGTAEGTALAPTDADAAGAGESP